MSSAELEEDRKLFASLALAVVRQPRASLQELAKSAGISKATLYRNCRTREQLYERLLKHAVRAIGDSIQNAGLSGAEPREALRRLIESLVANREVTIFLIHYWKNTAGESDVQADWKQAMDAFFLRGQQQGVFRVDIPAAALTEICAAILTGLLDAECRGRVARVGISTLIETAFLNGALAPSGAGSLVGSSSE